MIRTPEEVTGVNGEASHGGKGEYFVRTLLDLVPNSVFKYVRDLTLYPDSTIGEHLHTGDEEIYFIVSGTAEMVINEKEQEVGPGSAILTQSGSYHGLRNVGSEDLRVLVVCAKSALPHTE